MTSLASPKKSNQYPGFHTILNSLDQQAIEKSLQKWESQVRNGHIKRITDEQLQFPVFEILGMNVNTNFIALPQQEKDSLGITMPVLVILGKNLDKYFTFEVQILDDKNVRRTFKCSNFQSITRIKPFFCSMPLKLDNGWNEIQFNLEDFCQKAFGTNFVQVCRVKIFANCRVARVYFNDRVYPEEEIPTEYKLFLRVQPYISNRPADKN